MTKALALGALGPELVMIEASATQVCSQPPAVGSIHIEMVKL